MYPSKILLFGEYSILLNSKALAIPFPKFKADWNYLPKDADKRVEKEYASNQALKEFASHLKLSEKKWEVEIDIDRFEEDLKVGLFLDSNIPTGSGLGSSGALVAAVYDQYAKPLKGKANHTKLKSDLANLESYFHGSSSGIDPLVSLLNKAIILKDGKSIEEIDFPPEILEEYNLFLIDSRIARSTEVLVELFKSKCKNDPAFLKALKEKYIPINNACIGKLIDTASSDEFFPVVKELSHLQSSLFPEMIPESIFNLMKFGLESDLFYLKLCGSGGGGHFLGFTKSITQTRSFMEDRGYKMFVY